jgi:hypothetical protein
LGSACASRADDGALAIANFSGLRGNNRSQRTMDCGEAPQSAREARALPRMKGRLYNLLIVCCICALVGCETANYVPPVTPQMVSASSRTRDVDLVKLREGRTLFVHRCIACHTLPALWRYTTKDWAAIVNSMSHRASLTTAERDAIVAYIVAVRSTQR